MHCINIIIQVNTHYTPSCTNSFWLQTMRETIKVNNIRMSYCHKNPGSIKALIFVIHLSFISWWLRGLEWIINIVAPVFISLYIFFGICCMFYLLIYVCLKAYLDLHLSKLWKLQYDVWIQYSGLGYIYQSWSY